MPLPKPHTYVFSVISKPPFEIFCCSVQRAKAKVKRVIGQVIWGAFFNHIFPPGFLSWPHCFGETRECCHVLQVCELKKWESLPSVTSFRASLKGSFGLLVIVAVILCITHSILPCIPIFPSRTELISQARFYPSTILDEAESLGELSIWETLVKIYNICYSDPYV